MDCSCHSLVYRALVTYSNERTGEILVKIPSITGIDSIIPISYIGRSSTNGIWVVPSINEQIIVSADDHNLSNIFWIHTDAWAHSSHQRNYFEALDTGNHSATLTGGIGDVKTISYNTTIFAEGIRLVDGSKITFDYEGIYNLQYSIQWLNTDSQDHDSVVWIAYNGNHYDNSSTYSSVPSRHGNINGTLVTAINFVGKAFAGDYVELKWAANATTVSMQTITAGAIAGLPNTGVGAPDAPCVIVTVTQVA